MTLWIYKLITHSHWSLISQKPIDNQVVIFFQINNSATCDYYISLCMAELESLKCDVGIHWSNSHSFYGFFFFFFELRRRRIEFIKQILLRHSDQARKYSWSFILKVKFLRWVLLEPFQDLPSLMVCLPYLDVFFFLWRFSA
jgi:hypothetical protein